MWADKDAARLAHTRFSIASLVLSILTLVCGVLAIVVGAGVSIFWFTILLAYDRGGALLSIIITGVFFGIWATSLASVPVCCVVGDKFGETTCCPSCCCCCKDLSNAVHLRNIYTFTAIVGLVFLAPLIGGIRMAEASAYWGIFFSFEGAMGILAGLSILGMIITFGLQGYAAHKYVTYAGYQGRTLHVDYPATQGQPVTVGKPVAVQNQC